jgi:transcriptional regulator EpsA
MNGSDMPTDPNDVAVLGARDQEWLLLAIEYALPIRSRGQLLVWAQSYLQAIIEHKLLLCAYGDIRRPNLRTLNVSARRFSEDQLAELTDPRSGLMVHAIAAWYNNAEEPLSFYAQAAGASGHDQIFPILERFELGNCVVHGVRSMDGATGSYFLFSGIPHAFGALHAYKLRLILPYMVRALEQILALETRQHAVEMPAQDSKPLLTQREIGILRHVQDGKSNKEIAIILEISPLTVKNHVQSVLKKLKAQTRAQAVSRAIALKLLL